MDVGRQLRETERKQRTSNIDQWLQEGQGAEPRAKLNRHATAKHVIVNVAPRFLTSPGWFIKTTSGNMLVEQSTGYERDNEARTMRDFLS
jgi:hypothetical protein